MLNLWKKIQEKGLPASPKRNNVVIQSLDPRYDGPLRFFDVNSAVDVTPLEKGRLTLELKDLFINKMACSYFKQYLDTRTESEIFCIWNALAKKTQAEKIFKWNNDEIEEKENLTDVANELSDFQIKFLDQIRFKVFKSEETTFNYSDVSSLQTLLHQILSYLWHEFTRSEWYCRYQIELLTSRMVNLGDILLHETALCYFTQFLEIEDCHTIIEFWLAVSNFQQLVERKNDNVDDNQILDDAINIYEKYLSLLATCPLGFNDTVRSSVEEAICNEMHAPTANSFECAVNVALSFLRKYYLVPFLSSQHYVHLISDMIRQCTSLMNHSTSASSVGEYDPATSPKQLDPHLIWQRRKQSGLSFGKVDKLGRFRSDIEPDPGRNEESRISKMMKKFVHKNVTRVEEEMAWQVAEMVVKDVTDLTLGGPLENTVAENSFCNKYCK